MTKKLYHNGAKVLIINPPNVPFSPNIFLIEPIDVLGIASYIDKFGHSVEIIDMDANKIDETSLFSYTKYSKYDYALIVYDYHIPLHTDASLNKIFDIAQSLRSKVKTICVAGKIATYKPELLLLNPNIDIAISHEAENTFLEIVENSKILNSIKGITYLENNKLISTPKAKPIPLEQFPIPNYNLVDINNYIDIRTLLTSRGCSNFCSFCNVPNFWGKWKCKSAEQVVSEIENLALKYNSKKIMFLDDNAMVSKTRMRKICDFLIQKNINIKLGCLSSIALFDEELMKHMYRAGFCWIHYGAESGSDRILKQNNKNQKLENLIKVITKTKQIGFRIRSSWIIDLPNSSSDDIKHTISTIKELKTDEIRIHFYAKRLGIKDQNKENFNQYIHSSLPVNNETELSSTQISHMVEELISSLEKDNYLVLRNLNDYQKFEKLDISKPDIKVVSLCPLRYGIGWNR